MEKETFLTGYCRSIDESRMVAVVTEGSILLEVDCCFETCVHSPNCTVAQSIRNILENEDTV